MGRPGCLQRNRLRSGGGRGFSAFAVFDIGADGKRAETGLAGSVQRNDAEGSRGADRSVAAPCEQAYPVGNGENKEEIYGDHVSCRDSEGMIQKKQAGGRDYAQIWNQREGNP